MTDSVKGNKKDLASGEDNVAAGQMQDELEDRATQLPKHVSYDKMIDHVDKMHPRELIGEKELAPFDTRYAQIGEITLDFDGTQLTDIEKEIGIGMSLYLRHVKCMAVMMLICTIVSVPSFNVYVGGEAITFGRAFFK